MTGECICLQVGIQSLKQHTQAKEGRPLKECGPYWGNVGGQQHFCIS